MSDVIKALAVTAELMGTEWSEGAARVIAEELKHYPTEHVIVSLSRCRKEIRGRLTLTDILDRLPGGHPGPEEAWSCVSRGMKNEALTVVWTDPMREAYGVASALADDLVAARVAFKETYQRLVAEARAMGGQPAWSVSRGTDKADQELQITEAVKAGKLTGEYAHKLLPNYVDSGTALAITKQMNLA